MAGGEAIGPGVASRLAAGSLDPQGPVAEKMADLWWPMLWMGTAVFLLVAVLLLVGLFRRRKEPPDQLREPSYGRWLVGGGVVLPTVGVVAVLGLTLVAMRAIPVVAPSDALEIELVGHQWWWEVGYPAHEFETANEIHIPVGAPVELQMTSEDVIHSFWVPALAGKIDLLPDGTNTLVLEAAEAGEYRGACAEFCGLQHAKMRVIVVAEPPDRYEEWVVGQSRPGVEPSGDAARRGRQIFAEAECDACHTIRGTPADGELGPDLTHLASRQTLAAVTIPNTPAHLTAWVSDPQEIKEGTRMPDIALAADELEALVAYLETLE